MIHLFTLPWWGAISPTPHQQRNAYLTEAELRVCDPGEAPRGANCVSSSCDINAFSPLPAYVVAGDGSIGSRTLDAIRSRSNTQSTRDS